MTEPFNPLTKPRFCYVFDIDGTVADCSHRLHHINKVAGKDTNWPAFFAAAEDDTPIHHMIELAHKLWASTPLVFLSGRPDETREATLNWLERQGFKQIGDNRARSFGLYMRREGDYREDSIVKSESMDQLLEDGFVPIMVFEDRARVVKMWRERGIPCAQVAEGDY